MERLDYQLIGLGIIAVAGICYSAYEEVKQTRTINSFVRRCLEDYIPRLKKAEIMLNKSEEGRR